MPNHYIVPEENTLFKRMGRRTFVQLLGGAVGLALLEGCSVNLTKSVLRKLESVPKGQLLGMVHNAGYKTEAELDEQIKKDAEVNESYEKASTHLKSLPKGSVVVIEDPNTKELGINSYSIFSKLANEAKKYGHTVYSFSPQNAVSRRYHGYIFLREYWDRYKAMNMIDKLKDRLAEEYNLPRIKSVTSYEEADCLVKKLMEHKSDFLLQTILRKKPDLVIAGAGHTFTIAPYLKNFEDLTPSQLNQQVSDFFNKAKTDHPELYKAFEVHRVRVLKRYGIRI
jgi:hypothetical protein